MLKSNIQQVYGWNPLPTCSYTKHFSANLSMQAEISETLIYGSHTSLWNFKYVASINLPSETKSSMWIRFPGNFSSSWIERNVKNRATTLIFTLLNIKSSFKPNRLKEIGNKKRWKRYLYILTFNWLCWNFKSANRHPRTWKIISFYFIS